jgi:hypothetical protein
MGRTSRLTRGLAIAGTTLAWLPMLAPLALGFFSLAADGIFRFDYLLPAEVFPVALAGGGLLIWAAVRARSRRALAVWGLGVAVAALVATQVLAEVTGLASGAAEPVGWLLTIVMAGLAVFWAGLLTLGVGGILLLIDLFRKPGEETGPSGSEAPGR